MSKEIMNNDYHMPISEICNQYEALSTSIVNDVLSSMGFMYQALPSSIKPVRDYMKACGLAFTIKGTKSIILPEDMDLRARMLNSIFKDAFVVFDTTADEDCIVFGGMMSTAAYNAGARGLCVDGGVRDISEVLALGGFSVFHRYRVTSSMHGRFTILEYEEPIKIGDTLIRPNDFIFADQDGILCIPKEVAIEVLNKSKVLQADRDKEYDAVIRGIKSPCDVICEKNYI